jgi:hypothetical protein
MLASRPGDRPRIDQVFSELRDEALLAVGVDAHPARRVQVNMAGSGSAPEPSGNTTRSRVRINLGNNTKER